MKYFSIIFILILICCSEQNKTDLFNKTGVELLVLGTVQDAGSPQAGCYKDCCALLWDKPPHDRKVVSLGIIDHDYDQSWIFEASPDFVFQNDLMTQRTGKDLPSGIFITHAHIGHYTGLMYLGRETMGAKNISVYSMPRFGEFLKSNGPWSQLVSLKNILIEEMVADSTIVLNNNISITPFLVPHRDEFSETVGFKLEGPAKKILFIPDIDKWNLWSRNIITEIKKVDLAFLDGTFYKNGELKNRDMSEVPHPFIEESMELFKDLDSVEKSKIHFIHFNHTNPLLQEGSEEMKELENQGYNIAGFLDVFNL